MRGNQIVIPKALQQRIVSLAHMGHQGIVKTKQLLRSYVWFKGMSSKVEQIVKTCTKCQVNTDSRRMAPFRMTKMPIAPWISLCIDYYGPLKNGKYLLVLIDEHSRYPIVRIVSSTAFKALKPILEDIFAMFGEMDTASNFERASAWYNCFIIINIFYCSKAVSSCLFNHRNSVLIRTFDKDCA